MIGRTIGAAAAALLISASPVAAGRSGGHGGGGHHPGGNAGHSQSSHGGHGSYGHGSDCAAPPVLGYRTCSRFGDWDRTTRLPAVAFELLTTARTIRLAPISIAGTTALESTRLQFTADRRSIRTMHAFGIGLRGTLGIGAGLYVGLEGEIGIAPRAVDVGVSAVDTEPLTAWQGNYGQAVAVLGARHTLGSTRVEAELAGGVLATPVSARFADDLEIGEEHTTTLSQLARRTAEARLRITRWLTPWVTLGGFAAAGLTRRGYSAGLSLGLHLRAFDGGR